MYIGYITYINYMYIYIYIFVSFFSLFFFGGGVGGGKYIIYVYICEYIINDT